MACPQPASLAICACVIPLSEIALMNSFHCMIPEVYRLTDVLVSGFPLSAFQIVPVDILPALKDGDSFCKTAMSRRENVPGGVDVAVVYRAAFAANPFSKHVDSPF